MISPESRHTQWRAVAMPTAIILFLLVLIVGSILHFSTSRSDQLALARQQQLLTLAIRQNMAAIANDQEASTYWDDAVLRTRERPLDLPWLDNNLGVWFHTYYHHDQTYLLDAADRPIYGMQAGVRADPASFNQIAGRTLPLVAALRAELRNGYRAPKGAAGQTIGASAIETISGRPAIISVKPIVSETGTIWQQPGSEYLHVSVRYLDGNFLDQLSSLYGIDRLRLARAPVTWGSLPLTGSDGKVLGYLTWAPFEPGEQVEDRMIPVLLMALSVVGILLCLMLSRVRRGRIELEASRAEAQRLAFHDSLTGLPNRALFEQRVEQVLSRGDRRVATLLLDLDRFKHVNDTMGHPAGDALIRDFGRRLSALTRDCDTIARLGGDEFAILIEDACIDDIRGLAGRIVRDIGRPFDLAGGQAHVGVSIGIAYCDKPGTDRQELIRQADIALYGAKGGGRSQYCLFSPEMDASVQLRSMIEEELRHALGSKTGLCLHYQPQVGGDGDMVGVEALVRWDHPVRGLITPEQFIPIAEETGLIVPLGEWVLAQACSAASRWPDLFVSVNLSPVQFRSPGLFESLISIVRASGATPGAMQLEVNERVLLDDDEITRTTLDRLKNAGFKLVLDDFGTGYSSLGFLRKFQVDKVKIDQSFIHQLGDSSDMVSIVGAMIAMGRAMGLPVAAEGVETDAQRAFLRVAGCSEMQGYYFSEAVPEEQIDAMRGERAWPSISRLA